MSSVETQDMSCLGTHKMGHPDDTHSWVTHLTQNHDVLTFAGHVRNQFGSIGDIFWHRFGMLPAMFWDRKFSDF